MVDLRAALEKKEAEEAQTAEAQVSTVQVSKARKLRIEQGEDNE